MIIAEWLVTMLIISFSIFMLGIGSVLFVICLNVVQDWRELNG